MTATYRLWNKLLLIPLLLLTAEVALAQQEGLEDPWIDVWVDSSEAMFKKRFLPTGLRLAADVFSPLRASLDEDRTGYELAADLDVNKFYIMYNTGYSRQRYVEDDLLYRNRGQFQRVGIGYNLTNTNRGLNAIIFGIHRGSATWWEALNSIVNDPFWGVLVRDELNENMRATWTEVSLGLRVRVTGQFFMGYDFRLAFGRTLQEGDFSFSSFETPGYGRSRQGGNLSFQYFLQYRIPWAKKYISPKKFE